MKRPQLVSKGTIMRMRQAAQQAWQNRDLDQCVDLLDRASKISPTDTGILLQLGRMQGLRYDFEAAERSFDKAIRMAAPDKKAEALASAGQQARDFYNKEIAERYLMLASEEKNAAPEILVRLAEVYERHRRIPEAAALVDRALEKDKSCPEAMLARGRLAHRTGKLEEAEQLLRPLQDVSIKPDTRVRAWYETGTVLDRLGRYDDAMAAFLKAKALLRSDGSRQFAELCRVRAHLKQMQQRVTAETLQRWFEFGKELQPTYRLALLGGHPRSGTTLLEQILDVHPEIVSAEETNNFADYTYSKLQRRLPRGAPFLEVLKQAPKDLLLEYRGDYLRASGQCVGCEVGNRILIDKNPSLTFMIPAFVRIFPEARFLVAVRDPRDIVLSCFMQSFLPVQQVSSAYLSLETAADEYVSLMGTWRTLAPILKNPAIEVRYEDVVEDLESVARKVLAFFEVPWDERVLEFNKHAQQKVVRSPTYSDVTQKVFKRAKGRWLNYQKYLEPCLHKLEPFVKAFGYE